MIKNEYKFAKIYCMSRNWNPRSQPWQLYALSKGLSGTVMDTGLFIYLFIYLYNFYRG